MNDAGAAAVTIPNDLFTKIEKVITDNSGAVMTGIGLVVSALAIFWFVKIAIRIVKSTGSAIAR